MELDSLKESWKQSAFHIKNKEIMEIIQHKSHGPVAALKRAFLRQARMMILIPAMLVMVMSRNSPNFFSSILFWCYLGFCLSVILFSMYNYRTVKRMEGMDGQVKQTLENQISMLEKNLRWNTVVLRISLFFFIALLEILPYFQSYRMLQTWHALHPAIRVGAYAGFILLQYFADMSRPELGRE